MKDNIMNHITLKLQMTRKLQILAISMFMLISYITQADQDQRGQARKNIKSQINAHLETTLGGSVTPTSLANYAQQLPAAISAATSADAFKKLMILYMNIGAGLKQLAPQIKQDERKTKAQIDAQLAAALNSSVSFESLSTYANQLPTAIANLNASSTSDQSKAVVDMYINIGAALQQLAPKQKQN